MNLSTLSLAALRDLQKNLPAEIKKREAQVKASVLAEVKAFAEKRGFSLDELLPSRITPRAHHPVPIKFRDPQNNTLVWSGRGRTPRWVNEHLSHGGSLDSLRITGNDNITQTNHVHH